MAAALPAPSTLGWARPFSSHAESKPRMRNWSRRVSFIALNVSLKCSLAFSSV